ncbi:activating signal cointegrator 1 complex subunit 1 isoform X2 [Leptopilina boulardi]|uniref:activating signal cointegrator 1 complex subunit 1 isoform X2 n=1 Tax=Leptopilina boulardi TaxID=63433 RepID=UPI0021F63E60|nr:activating signal cointegrator 1 complex subunit 1 isoform X2 [Leptopilina boulardi]
MIQKKNAMKVILKLSLILEGDLCIHFMYPGATKKRLEVETKTNIHVPKMGQEGDIVILGTSRRSIISARNRIDLLVESSRKKVQFTHFLSIPLTDKNIIDAFREFKNDVIHKTGKGARRVNEKIFQNEERLHLTLDVLKLMDENERQAAAKKLIDCKKDIIDPFLKDNGPINLVIKGIEIMNDDSSEVKILYAKVVDSENVFQTLADNIVKYFVKDGLINPKYNCVKLHMTIMNTKFALKDDKESVKGDWGTFDATNIMKIHKDTYFGGVKLSTIHLSQRNTRNEFGYYKDTAKIDV